MWKYLLLFNAVLLMAACKTPPPQIEIEAAAEPVQSQILPAVPEGETAPIQIIEPELTIIAIKILQADLINTSMELRLHIDNPNTFPLILSSFRYELYGDGRFWASGVEKKLSVVPAQGSSVTSLEFEMNFTNMRRRILDDIIAMRQVRYRISGDVEMGTDTAEVPGFLMRFDLSGESAVLK